MKVAIYSRKSKFTGKGESIENQIQLCKEYAYNQLKDRDITDFCVYEDEGFSGGNTNRPEFQRLLDDAKAKKFDILICYRLDRISRNVSDFSNTLELLQRNSIDFVSIREQFDTSSPMGRAMIYIASVFAQLERETIAERVRDNMLELAKTGRWLGGTAPIGYDAEPVTYFDQDMKERSMVKLKQNLKELEIVQLIFDKYLEFRSLSKVETYCLQNDIKSKRGKNFSKANLSVILTNPVYVKANQDILNYMESEEITVCGEADNIHGMLTYNKQKTVSTDEGKITHVKKDKSEWIAAVSSQKGIIEANIWLEVQQTLKKNKDTFPNLGKTHNALLTGLLKCKKCNSNMQVNHGHISVKTNSTLFYYACPIKKFSKGVKCDCVNGKVAEIDEVVLSRVENLHFKKAEILNSIKQDLKENKKTPVKKENSLTKSISEKQKQIDNLVNKLAIDDDISDLIISKIKTLKGEVEELKKELKEINNLNQQYDDTELNLSLIENLINRGAVIRELNFDNQKELLNSMITEIIWDDINKNIHIEFVWGKKKLN